MLLTIVRALCTDPSVTWNCTPEMAFALMTAPDLALDQRANIQMRPVLALECRTWRS